MTDLGQIEHEKTFWQTALWTCVLCVCLFWLFIILVINSRPRLIFATYEIEGGSLVSFIVEEDWCRNLQSDLAGGAMASTTAPWSDEAKKIIAVSCDSKVAPRGFGKSNILFGGMK